VSYCGTGPEEERSIVAIVVILVLAILWAAVLIPPILRARNEGGGGSSIGAGLSEILTTVSSAFGHQRPSNPDLPGMQPLVGPVGPVGGAMGPRRGQGGTTPAQRRRRTVLVGLLGAAGITLVMAAFSGGNVVFLGLQGATDVLLGAYVYLLLQLKTRQSTRRSPQLRPAEPAGPRRHLRPVPAFGDLTPVPEPAFALRRTATF
jgi:hypothetical protein